MEMQKFGQQSWYNTSGSKNDNTTSSSKRNQLSDVVCTWNYQYTMIMEDHKGNTLTVHVYKEECTSIGGGGDDNFGGGDGDIGGGDDPCIDDEGNTMVICEGGGGGGGNGGPGFTADDWEAIIDYSELKPCMQDIMRDLKQLQEGVGQIVDKFAGETPGYNWKVMDGELPQYSNAQTSQDYDEETGTVVTTFDSDKFGQATDLSVARTMLHEAIHAYLISYSRNNPMEFREDFSEMLQDYNDMKYGGDANDIQHAEFARNFVKDIGAALSEFGNNNGYNLFNEFYEDLAWGGLTHYENSQGDIVQTPFFKNAVPNAEERNSIIDKILIEQTGENSNGNNRSQKGNDAGC